MTCSGSFEADDVTSHARSASLCYGTDEWEFFCCCFYCPIIFMRFLLLYFPFEEVFRLAFRILCVNSHEYRATEGNCCPNLHLTRSAPALPFDRDFSVLEFIFAFPSFLHNWMNEPTLCLFNVCLLLLRAVTGWNVSLGLERNRQLGSLISPAAQIHVSGQAQLTSHSSAAERVYLFFSPLHRTGSRRRRRWFKLVYTQDVLLPPNQTSSLSGRFISWGTFRFVFFFVYL